MRFRKGISMKGKLPVKILDFVIILLALGLTGASAFAVYVKQPQNDTQVLIQGPSQAWVFPLDAEETVNVPGALGTTVVRIHENQAWVESSPCNNQICVAMGRVGYMGGFVACLPNNVILVIEGNHGQENIPDSIAW